MVAMFSISYPLENTPESVLEQLCRTLWSWPSTDWCGCPMGESCIAQHQRLKRLSRFFIYYKDITASYDPDVLSPSHQALSSHDDLFEIVKQLKLQPDVTRRKFSENLFANRTGGTVVDRQRAIRLAVEVMFMVNCSPQGIVLHLNSLERGFRKTVWRDDTTLAQFISNAFPMTDHPGINDQDATFSNDMKNALLARNLKKLAGLKFRSTDDLRNHLKLDQRAGIVDIYHHTAFLKEHLRLTKDAPRNLSVADYLRKGALPRQLALEALDSIQKILFPLSDAKSYSLLRSLTSTASFDPDCLRFESASIRGEDEKDIQYLHFGARLADLYEELENPKPRGWVERWFERKSGARYVMMATLIGVAIAVFLGLAGLAVSGYQTYIAYQQWKHPVLGS